MRYSDMCASVVRKTRWDVITRQHTKADVVRDQLQPDQKKVRKQPASHRPTQASYTCFMPPFDKVGAPCLVASSLARIGARCPIPQHAEAATLSIASSSSSKKQLKSRSTERSTTTQHPIIRIRSRAAEGQRGLRYICDSSEHSRAVLHRWHTVCDMAMAAHHSTRETLTTQLSSVTTDDQQTRNGHSSLSSASTLSPSSTPQSHLIASHDQQAGSVSLPFTSVAFSTGPRVLQERHLASAARDVEPSSTTAKVPSEQEFLLWMNIDGTCTRKDRGEAEDTGTSTGQSLQTDVSPRRAHEWAAMSGMCVWPGIVFT